MLGRYELGDVLGIGGMGRVVRARDPKLRRDVALKLVELSDDNDEGATEFRRLLHREAQTTAQLDHNGIVRVYDYSGPEEALPYIVYELIEAPTVEEIIAQHAKGLPVRSAVALCYEICCALECAHQAGVLHRDLKPANVFWASNGRVTLADFGIGTVMADAKVELGHTFHHEGSRLYGSIAYMAPELFSGARASFASDLYALGALLLEALTGAQAFEAATMGELIDNVRHGRRALRVTPATVPASVHSLIDDLLNLDPGQRTKDATTARSRLRALLDELEVGDPRVFLLNHGTRDPDAAGEYGEETALFSELSDTIRIQKARHAPRASRAPFALAMIGVALGLGIAASLMMQLSSFPDSGAMLAGDGSMFYAEENTFVLLRFPGTSTVYINGKKLGTFDERVRFSISEGEHVVALSSDRGRAEKTVNVLEDTTPTFDFSEADFSK